MPKQKYKKLKVCCPNDKGHKGYDKILFVFEKENRRLWLHCNDRNCRKWVRVDISDTNGVICKIMPDNYHLDFERMPTLVVED